VDNSLSDGLLVMEALLRPRGMTSCNDSIKFTIVYKATCSFLLSLLPVPDYLTLPPCNYYHIACPNQPLPKLKGMPSPGATPPSHCNPSLQPYVIEPTIAALQAHVDTLEAFSAAHKAIRGAEAEKEGSNMDLVDKQMEILEEQIKRRLEAEKVSKEGERK
jgi:hypothetical protein